MEAKEKLCIIIASDIGFLGGLGTYQKNLLPFLKENFDITYIYKGNENKDEIKDNIRFIQIKTPRVTFLENIFFELRALSILNTNKFDVINSHGFTGLWMLFFNKKNAKMVHTYHGSTYYFYKNHLKRVGAIKRLLAFPALFFPYMIEMPPMKKADRIICNSKHVMNEMIELYGKRDNIFVLRTGVDLKIFKQINKKKARRQLKLDQKLLYGLYVGRGGYWTKGLDKVINLSKEIYELNKNFRLLVVGADLNKVNHLIDKRFTILFPAASRDKIFVYYNAADIFFSMSRYEGGAPNMVTSEAMASGCLVITDKEANQEIIENEKNGVIVSANYKEEAKRMLGILNNKNKSKEIIKKSLETSKELSLKNWGKEYLGILLE